MIASVHCMQTVQAMYKQRGCDGVSDPILAASETVPALRLTVWKSGEQLIPVQQIGQLGLQEFSKIYIVMSTCQACKDLMRLQTVPSRNASTAAAGVCTVVDICDPLSSNQNTVCSMQQGHSKAFLRMGANPRFGQQAMLCITCAVTSDQLTRLVQHC